MDGGTDLRLLIVSQYFWPEDFRINEFAISMAARGHEVTVLTSVPNYPEGIINDSYAKSPRSFDRYGRIDVVRVPQIVRGSSKLQLLMNYASFAFSASLIGPWKLRRRPFDAVFVFQTSPVTVGIPGGLLAWLKQAPMLMWILDCWPDTLKAIGVGSGPLAQSMVGLLVKAIYASADLLLGQSRGFEANVARYGDRAKFRHFPNWVEAVYLNAPSLPRHVDDGRFVLLYAGNVGEAQDFVSVVDAAEQLRGDTVLFRIVGDGRDLPRLREDVTARGLDSMFDFVGRHRPEAMPGFFAQADALLVSLKPDPLFAMTVPGKVQTYLAAGRPILAMLDGEGAAVVRDSGAGLAVPAGSPNELAEAVRTLMATPTVEREAMAARGSAYAADHYSLPKLLDQLEAWFRDVQTPPITSALT